MSYEIKPHRRIGPELQELARAEVSQIIAALRLLDAGTLDGLRHEIRQRLKALRAVIRLLRGPLGKRRYRMEDGVIRAAGRAPSGRRSVRPGRGQKQARQPWRRRKPPFSWQHDAGF